MLFHIYADYASEGLIKAIVFKHFTNDPVFDRSMALDNRCGESDRLLHGFAVFVKNALEQNAKKVFVFDLFDRVDIAKGEALAEILAPLFAAGVEIHASAECGENEVSHAVLKAARASGYRTKITKALPR